MKYMVIIVILIYIQDIYSISIELNGWWLEISLDYSDVEV